MAETIPATRPEQIQIFHLERELPSNIEKLGFVYLQSPLGIGRKKWDQKIRAKASSIGADGILLVDRITYGSDGEVQERYLAFRNVSR